MTTKTTKTARSMDKASLSINDVIALVRESGLPALPQKAFLKVGEGTRRIYVAIGKKVSRIDLAGFVDTDVEKNVPGVRRLDADERHDNVDHELDFKSGLRPEELVESLRTLLFLTKELPPCAAVRKSGGKRGPREKGVDVAAMLADAFPAPAPTEGQGGEEK